MNMKRTVILTSCMLALILVGFGCKTKVKQNNDSMTYDKGSFGYDASFMQQHQNSIVLKKGDARVLLVPAYQGRVMTSSAAGESGMSFGWLNYALIEAGKPVAHFNNYGGEERLWLGPEGGQFSIFFPPGAAFEFDYWQVPAPIDTEPFDLVSANDTMAIFARDTEFTNYSGYRFLTRIQRTVWLLDKSNVYQQYGILIPEELQMVAYQSENQITNTGKMPWSHETGLLSVWVLGQLISSPSNIVLAPFADGPQSELGPVVNDNYFGKVPPERLKILDKLILFKADGLQRGKIGLSPLRAKIFWVPLTSTRMFSPSLNTINPISMRATSTACGNSNSIPSVAMLSTRTTMAPLMTDLNSVRFTNLKPLPRLPFSDQVNHCHTSALPFTSPALQKPSMPC